MPGSMFQDMVSLRTRSHRKRYTVPLSFLVHTTALAVLVAVPLIATGGLGVGQVTVDALPPVVAAPQAPVVVSDNIRPPARTEGVMPEYPALARSMKIEGVVIIEAIIGVDGRIEQARVLRPKPFLDEAALAAVREWEYTPALLNGRPTRVIMTVTVNYTLNP